MTLTTLICPSCGLSDMLRRLSSVQATPRAFSSHDGEGGTRYHIVADNRLTAPPPPRPPPPLNVAELLFTIMAYQKRRIAAIAEAERRIAEEEHPLWVRRTALWSVAFYCSRCDMVMIPAGVVPGPLANGMSCHADDLHAALSDRARHLDEDALRQLASWQPRYKDK